MTDPEARLYTKSSGQAALPCHSMHVLMENRRGIGVDIRVGKADGYAERRCALRMLDRVKRKLGLEPATLGADKGYDTEEFLLALEQRGIEPHVSCKSKKEIDVPREGQMNEEGVWARWFNQQGQRDRAVKISQRKCCVDTFCSGLGHLTPDGVGEDSPCRVRELGLLVSGAETSGRRGFKPAEERFDVPTPSV